MTREPARFSQTRASRAAEMPDRLAEIAHDLRAPIGGIEAMSEVIAAGPLTDTQRQAVEALIASARHLRTVASSIIDAKGAASSEVREAENIDLRAFLADIAAAARLRAVAQGAQFSLDVAAAVPAAVSGRPSDLRRMIENLIDNAMKFCAGAVTLQVERLGRRGRQHRLRVQVRDDGPGFTAAQAQRLFRPYERLDENVPGSGLGLSIVRRLARSMGGDAFAEAQPEGGATVGFTVSLAAATATVPSPAPRREKPHILVVDDHAASRLVATVVLSQFGCEVTSVATGEEALSTAAAGRFDAVVMDMTLTGLDGPATTRRLRELPAPAGGVPVIALTGRVGDEDRAAFIEAGANAFVSKPLSPRTLWQALGEVGLSYGEARSPAAA